jgi:hypothetical protein
MQAFVGTGENPRLQNRRLELDKRAQEDNQQTREPPEADFEPLPIEKPEKPGSGGEGQGKIGRDGFSVL